MRFLVVIAMLLYLPCAAMAEGVAIFPVKLLDTSNEASDQQDAHRQRLEMLADTLGSQLGGATLITPEQIARCSPETIDCLMSVAREAKADQALFVVALKTSTLILQLFANLAEVENQSLIASHNLNFRGDNDEAWRRAGTFLARQLNDDIAR